MGAGDIRKIALAASAVLVFAVGCGGGGSASLTKAEFVKHAQYLCNKEKQKREELLQTALASGKQNPSQKEGEKLILSLLKPYEATTQQLKEFEVTPGERQKVDTIIEAREEALAKARANPETLYVNNAPFNHADKLSKAYGLANCVSS